jgi:uncharacterized protein (DUF1778 family)
MTVHAKPQESTHTRAINLRVRDETRALIDRAAQAQGRSRSDFMIEASRRAAEDAILDQAAIMTDRAGYERFLEILDAPAESNEKLRAILRAPAPWERR